MLDCNDDLPLLPLGVEASDASALSPVMQQCARNLYRQAWASYRDVGCPFGETDKAMFVWYSLHGRSSGPSFVTGKN